MGTSVRTSEWNHICWPIPPSKWVTTPLISRASGVSPVIAGEYNPSMTIVYVFFEAHLTNWDEPPSDDALKKPRLPTRMKQVMVHSFLNPGMNHHGAYFLRINKYPLAFPI